MNSIQVNFWQWLAQLNEHLEQRVIDSYMSELFSFYCCGAEVCQAAQAVIEIDRRPDL